MKIRKWKGRWKEKEKKKIDDRAKEGKRRN